MGAPNTTPKWIDHNGRGRPHSPLTYVEVRFRNGQIERGTSGFLNWVWDDDPDTLDVMAWRQIPEPPSKDTIIAALVEVLTEIVRVGHSGVDPIDIAKAERALALAARSTS